MLSVRWNRFRVCSACHKIVSAYAQQTHSIIFLKNTQKYKIKMQILTLNNQNFQKPSRNPSNRTKGKSLKKTNFWIAHQKNLVPRMLSHCGKMWTVFEHQNSGENRRKRREIFLKISKGHIRIWFRSDKNSKLSHDCAPLKVPKCENFDLLFFTLINHIWVWDLETGILFCLLEAWCCYSPFYIFYACWECAKKCLRMLSFR